MNGLHNEAFGRAVLYNRSCWQFADAQAASPVRVVLREILGDIRMSLLPASLVINCITNAILSVVREAAQSI